jgi:SAM-dependent methyltransferase
MKEPPRNFYEQRLWDEGYVQAELFVAPPDDLIRRWLQKHVPPGQGSCLELGCFPGRYLAVFGELGYEVNGIDLTPRVELDLKPWLQRRGYRVGEFIRDDVFTHTFGRRYDIVCSFGLIEHFEDWPGLLRRHAELVAEGGTLIVSTPNFRGGIQRLLHRWCDQENFYRHNLAAMFPDKWAQVAQAQNFEVIEAGCVGSFDFWYGAQRRNLLQKTVVKTVRRSVSWAQKLPLNNPAFAPFFGLIARKRRATSPDIC